MLNRSSCVLVLEFQRNNRPENQASLPDQAFIPVVQTSTPNCNVLQRCVLVLEFQGDSRENQASLPHQASVPVVQTSTPMWSWQEVLLRAEKGGGRSLVKPGKERTRRWNGCRAVVRCQQYLRLPRAAQTRTDGLPCLKELLTTYAFPYATTLQGSTTFPSLLTQPHTTRGFAGATFCRGVFVWKGDGLRHNRSHNYLGRNRTPVASLTPWFTIVYSLFNFCTFDGFASLVPPSQVPDDVNA